jgi:hypothetical protein
VSFSGGRGLPLPLSTPALIIQEGQRDKARQQSMQILLDAHDLIIRSYWAQKHGEEDGLAAAVGQQTRVHYNVTI